MTAAELASFRTLLQAQTTASPRPDRGLFARMRARLTVVEGARAPPGAPSRARAAVRPPRLVVANCEVTGAPVADPPPGAPPAFEVREFEPEPAWAARNVAVPSSSSDREPSPVRLRSAQAVEEAHATPDEPAPDRAAPAQASPGTIAGWSRVRPPSARRRILQRLDAVLTAERLGLEARIAADAPAR